MLLYYHPQRSDSCGIAPSFHALALPKQTSLLLLIQCCYPAILNAALRLVCIGARLHYRVHAHPSLPSRPYLPVEAAELFRHGSHSGMARYRGRLYLALATVPVPVPGPPPSAQ